MVWPSLTFIWPLLTSLKTIIPPFWPRLTIILPGTTTVPIVSLRLWSWCAWSCLLSIWSIILTIIWPSLIANGWKSWYSWNWLQRLNWPHLRKIWSLKTSIWWVDWTLRWPSVASRPTGRRTAYTRTRSIWNTNLRFFIIAFSIFSTWSTKLLYSASYSPSFSLSRAIMTLFSAQLKIPHFKNCFTVKT